MLPNIVANIATNHARKEREGGRERGIHYSKLINIFGEVRSEEIRVKIYEGIASEESEEAGAEDPAGARLPDDAEETAEQLGEEALFILVL